jgi:hypothetical protein
MLTVPGQSRPPSQRCTLHLDQVEDRWKLRNEALHGRDDAEHSLFHRALLCAKATRLYAKARTLLALDRPILSRPLITILDLSTTGLETWISRLNRLYSAASPTRMTTTYKPTQSTTTFPAIEMARNSGFPPLGLSHGALTGCTVTMAFDERSPFFLPP